LYDLSFFNKRIIPKKVFIKISFIYTPIIKYLLLYILILDIGQEKKVNNKKINILKLKEAERKKYLLN
jgi:hypothetical protein